MFAQIFATLEILAELISQDLFLVIIVRFGWSFVEDAVEAGTKDFLSEIHDACIAILRNGCILLAEGKGHLVRRLLITYLLSFRDRCERLCPHDLRLVSIYLGWGPWLLTNLLSHIIVHHC